MDTAASNQELKDFGLGCVGGLVLNALLVVVLIGLLRLIFGPELSLSRRTTDTVALLAFCGLPLLLNGIGIVALAVRRAWMALGAFVALALVGLTLVVLGAGTFWFLFMRGN